MSAYANLAALFRYPDEVTIRDARDLVPQFAEEIAALDLSDLQATYTCTFDLAPSCSPYLGIHVFGDENRDRGRLMVGLRLSYQRAGVSNDRELPDHIAEVFAFEPYAARDEWQELQSLVIKPALQKMDAILRPTTNPYRHLVSAALQIAGGES